MRILSFAIVLLIIVGLLVPTEPVSAVPPRPPAEFAQPQSPTRPEPFPIKYVDQGQFDPNLKGYKLPEGFRMEIAINEPDVINPVGMTFAPDGSLFVLEWRPDPIAGENWFPVLETIRYRDGTTRKITTMKKFTTDVVKHFAPNPRTGNFGPPRVIIAEELPSSILYHDGWLCVSGRGTVRRWRQAPAGNISGIDLTKAASPNDPWNVRETIAQGFCGFHHHQVSGLSIGNDGMLYITSGDDDNYVEGSDGSRATVLRTGAVFRCQPDGSKIETYSLGYRNPYRDLAHDEHFNWFHTDNDNEDGSKFMGCRVMHVAEGTDFGWRLRYGARCCRPDDARVSVGGEVPGKVAPMIKTGRGAPAGLLIYNDTFLPDQYRGLLYYPDVYRKLIRAYKTTPQGSTFQISNEFEFLKSDDPLFRPCQMVTGPDGAIYLCDWRTNSGGAGRLSGDGVHGRIYRVRWVGMAGTPEIPLRKIDSQSEIIKLDDEKLIDVLSSANITDRVTARKELVRRGGKAAELVLRRFVSGKVDMTAKLPAIGVLECSWNSDVEDLFRLLLRDESADVRRLATEGLGTHGKANAQRTFEALLRTLGDNSPAVRRAAALAIGRLGTHGSADAIINALRFDTHADPYLRDAYVRSLELLGKPGVEAILALAASGEKELRQAIDIFATLRIREGAEAVPLLLSNLHTTPAEREMLVLSLNNYQLDPPISLDPLADFLANRPGESAGVVSAALEVYSASPAGLDSPRSIRFVLDLLGRKEVEIRLAALAAIESSRLVPATGKLLEMLEEPDRPLAERVAVVKALRVLSQQVAVAPIQKLLSGPYPSSLKIESLRTLAALNAIAAREAATALLEQPDPALLEEAVVVLGSSKIGASLVAQRYLAGKLPRDMFPQVTDGLKKFANTDPAIAKLRSEVLKGGLLLSLEPGQIEKIRKLVVSKGDPVKGKELYLNTKVLACAKCHRIEGVGGSVGPDLTRVWDTHTIEKLLESIVEPSKEIKEGYQSYRLSTTSGLVVNGLKVSDTPKEVVLRDANGRDLRIAKGDIENISPEKISLMPEDAIAQLGFEQFIDLLAFLKSRKDQESLRGLVVEAGVSNPFPFDASTAKPEVVADIVKSSAKWEMLYADAAGRIDLNTLLTSKQPAGVYARAFVYSAQPQSVTATIQAEDPIRIWINDEQVFQRSGVRSSGMTEETMKINLKTGWNTVLLKVANEGKVHTLGLRFSGSELRTSGRPE